MQRWLRFVQAAAGLLCASLAGPASCAVPLAPPEAQLVAAVCGKPQPVKPQGGTATKPVAAPAIWVNATCERTTLGLASTMPAQTGVPPNTPPGAAPGTTPSTVPGAVTPNLPPSAPTKAASGDSKAASAAAADTPKTTFGDERRDGPILVALLAATALTLAGLGLLSSTLGWPGTGASTERIHAEPVYPVAPAEGFTFRRHWGSFGAESTGWSMSSRLAKLLAGLGLIGTAAMLMLLLLSVTDPFRKSDKTAPASTAAAAPAPVESALVPAMS